MMHELTITQELINNITAECALHGITNVKKITTRLGNLTTYSKESILFYFETLKKDNPALANTKLVIETENGKLRCNTCRKESYIQSPYLIMCPYCHSNSVSIIEGKNFIIRNLESD